MLTAAALLVASLGHRGDAQADGAPHLWIFRTPVFVFQPGLVSSNFVDKAAGTSASTKFNFRVVTVIPTTIPRTTVVAIVQWTPWNKSAGFNSNAPAFVPGAVFSLLNLPLFSLDFDVLDSYGAAARSSDESAYTNKLVFEGDLAVKVGGLMTHDEKSRWHSLALYAYLANVATGVPTVASRWAVLYGLSLPIAP
jgi:hypothetical protein